MKNKISISVILPIFNEKIRWLNECINSLLNQNFDDYEIIVILDDPSNKLIIDYMTKFKKNMKIRFLINEKNLKLPKTLNKGINLSKGKYIAIMNGDDICKKERLYQQFSYLEKNKLVDLIGGKYNLIDDSSNKIDKKNYIFKSNKSIKKALKYLSPICHPTWMGKRELFIDLKYNNLIGIEDMDFLCRAILRGYKISLINKVVLDYRIQENSITHKYYMLQTVYTMYLGKKYKSAYKSGEIENYTEFVSKLIKNPDLEGILSKDEIINMNVENEKYNKVINDYKKHNYFKFIKEIYKYLLNKKYNYIFRFKIKRRIYLKILEIKEKISLKILRRN